MLQCVAVCCSALQCVAVRCSALQCVAVRCSVLHCVALCCSVLQYCAVSYVLGFRFRVWVLESVYVNIIFVNLSCLNVVYIMSTRTQGVGSGCRVNIVL